MVLKIVKLRNTTMYIFKNNKVTKYYAKICRTNFWYFFRCLFKLLSSLLSNEPNSSHKKNMQIQQLPSPNYFTSSMKSAPFFLKWFCAMLSENTTHVTYISKVDTLILHFFFVAISPALFGVLMHICTLRKYFIIQI